MIRFFMILSLFSIPAWALDCAKVKVESRYASAAQEKELCYLTNKTFFISQNCLDLDCAFIADLKKLKIIHSEKDRTGTVLCRGLKGAIDLVSIEGSEDLLPQCVFADEEKSSISLNLLESWNGKLFSGPAPLLKLEEAK